MLKQAANTKERAIKEIVIPYIPAQIDFEDLYWDNRKLVTEMGIQALKRILADEPDGYHSKLTLNTRFSILSQNGKYYAIYYGGEPKQIRAKDGRRGAALGVGAFAVVKLVQDLDTGEWFAVKVQPEVMAQDADELERLIRAGKAVMTGHPENPVSISKLSKLSGELKNCMLMKLERGEELYYIEERKLAPIIWFDIIKNALGAVKRLSEEKSLLHCDLKGENILCDLETGAVELIDLAGAIEVKDSGKRRARYSTAEYQAPEHSLNRYNEKSQVFAMGMTLAILLGVMEFHLLANDQVDTVYLGESSPSFIEKIPSEQLRKDIMEGIDGMVAELPENRYSLDEAILFFTWLEADLTDQDKTVTVQVLDVKHVEGVALGEIPCAKSGELQLVDTRGVDDLRYYAEVKRELESQGYVVRSKVLSGASYDELFNRVASGVTQEGSARINRFVRLGPVVRMSHEEDSEPEGVSDQGEGQAPEMAVVTIERAHADLAFDVIRDPEQLAMLDEELKRGVGVADAGVVEEDRLNVLDGLRLELGRLRQKYRSDNIAAVLRDRAIVELEFAIQREKDMTYADLALRLKMLEMRMVSTTCVGRRLATLGIFANVTGRGKLKKLRKEIELKTSLRH